MKKSIAKTVGLVMIITMLSRLMALFSQQILLTRFGVNTHIDIYNFAVNFQVYAINCIGTTIITVMIPMFVGFLETGEKERAFKFANNVISLSFILTLVMSILGIIFAPQIVSQTDFSAKEFDFAVSALRIMFPLLIFYTLTYTFQGILQSQGRFLMPAFVSVSSSSIIIFYTLFLGRKFGVQGLLVATLIGLSSQALIQIPSMYRTEYRFFPSFELRSRDILDALKLAPPILISSSAYQVNMFYNLSVATYFDAVSLVNVGQQLVLVAILSMAISMTSVMFPKLTTLAASNNIPEFKKAVMKTIKIMVFILLPMTLGLAAVSRETIDFIYGYGKFTPENAMVTAKILALYSIGGVGLGIKEVADKAFYSLKDTVKPAIIGVIMMATNIGVSLVLIKTTGLGVFSIPVAYSTAALVGSASAMYILWKKIGSFGGMDFLKSSLKVAASAVAMVAVVIPLSMLMDKLTVQLGQAGTMGLVIKNGIKLFIPVGAGAVVFFTCTLLLKVEESVEVLEKVKAKVFKKKAEN